MHQIDQILDQFDGLPPAPRILPPLLSLLRKVDTDVSQVVDLVALDPGLTAKVLRTCNSAFFAASSPADDVTEAVSRLGFQSVYRAVAVVLGAPCLRPAQAGGATADQLWRHSVTTAFAAQLVAEEVGEDAGLFFTAGLLHDMGKALLAAVPSLESGSAELSVIGLSPAQEISLWGVDHAALGARLLERWKFSPSMVAGVRFHHTLSAAQGAGRAAACLALADALAHGMDQPETVPGTAVEPGSALQLLGLRAEAFPRYFERLQANYHFVQGMCRL